MSAAPYQYDTISDAFHPPPQQTRTAQPCRLRPVRLLHLHPGAFSDEIQIDLERTWLEADGGVSYEALSYVWGSTDNLASIWIGAGTLGVTQNLATALRHLRHVDRTRIMWIDAICIDQSNIPERNNQVSMMGDIYRLASTVIIWLGVEQDDSDYALDALSVLHSKITVDMVGQSVKPSSVDPDEAHWADKSRPLPYGRKELLALEKLIARPWFERLWIRQELHFGHKKASVFCGHRRVSWAVIAEGIFCIAYKDWGTGELEQWYVRVWERITLINKMSFPGTISLKSLRFQLGDRLCGDSRDRVYAALSILRSQEQLLGIVPDYSLTAGEIYKDTVLRYIRSIRDASILCECRPAPTSNLPSWVPDWSSPTNDPCFEATLRVRASGQLMAHATSSDGILNIAGVKLDVIEKVFAFEVDMKLDKFIPAIQHIVPDDAAQRSYPGDDGTLLEAYARTLAWGDFKESYEPPLGHRQSLSMTVRALQLLKEGVISSYQDEPKYFEEFEAIRPLNYYLSQKHLFRTAKGYLGLGSPYVQPGDEACIIIGCQYPMILRPNDKIKRHQMVGHSYLCGFMNGESLLGPLPSHCVSVTVADPGGELEELAFLDVGTRSAQLEDPRLSTLGIDLGPYRKEWARGNSVLVDVPLEMLEGQGIDICRFELA